MKQHIRYNHKNNQKYISYCTPSHAKSKCKSHEMKMLFSHCSKFWYDWSSCPVDSKRSRCV